MGKALETKRNILNLLKNRKMTITELSRELNLSNATVSQHMDELRSIGAVEKIDSEYFRKFKYYRPADPMPITARYIIGALALFVLLGGIYFYNLNQGHVATPNTLEISNNSTASGGRPGSFACIAFFYSINGTISNYSGTTAYYINSSIGTVPDYVIPNGTVAKFSITERISDVVQSNSTMPAKSHYAFIRGINNSTGSGIELSISPTNFTVTGPEGINATLKIAVNESASGSYWLVVDGPCGGGLEPVVITIGKAPYSGFPTYGPIGYR